MHLQPATVISSINTDRAIKSQKSKVSADISPQRDSEAVVSLFLIQDPCERLFLQTSTNAKTFFVLFYSKIGRRVSERKTAVALLFLFILQETRAISFRRHKEETCSFMSESHTVAACTVQHVLQSLAKQTRQLLPLLKNRENEANQST